MRLPVVSVLSLLTGMSLGARMCAPPIPIRETTEVAHAEPAPAAPVTAAPVAAPERTEVAPERVVAPPSPLETLVSTPLRRLTVPWAEVERVLFDSTLAATPAALESLCASTPDPWAVLLEEHAFDERIREIAKTAPTERSERLVWHESVFRPWLTTELPLFLDQLHRHRVPAEMVDRYRTKKLEHL